jgi:hypothetical protein
MDPLAVATQVAAILERLQITYVIGGSVASSILGQPRSTLDLDMMIDASHDGLIVLVRELGDDFFVDVEDAVASFQAGASFNAIHRYSSLKVDFFPAETLGREQLTRRRPIVARPDLPPLYFYAPEDLVIRKLQGGEGSTRQDVVSILKTSTLDADRLLCFARQQRLDELLRRAAADAGLRL